jgi:phytol kinase
MTLKKFRSDTDLTRKFTHIILGIIVFFSPYFLTKSYIITLGCSVAIIVLILKTLKLIPNIYAVSRQTMGEVYFPLGIAISAYFFLPNEVLAFQFGVLVLGFADAAASIVGIWFGKQAFYIFKNKKTFEGSLAFFVTTLCVYLGFGNAFGPAALIIALVLTVAEAGLVFGLDNLVLAVLASYLLILFR